MRLTTRLLCLAFSLAAALPAAAAGPKAASPAARAAWSAYRITASPARWAGGTRLAASASPAPLASRPGVLLDPPVNDQCSGAITIPCGNICESGTTFGATNDGSAGCGLSNTSPDGPRPTGILILDPGAQH